MDEYIIDGLNAYSFAISFPFAALLLGLHGAAALLTLGFIQMSLAIGGGLATLTVNGNNNK